MSSELEEFDTRPEHLVYAHFREPFQGQAMQVSPPQGCPEGHRSYDKAPCIVRPSSLLLLHLFLHLHLSDQLMINWKSEGGTGCWKPAPDKMMRLKE